jgi:hypothetical protein
MALTGLYAPSGMTVAETIGPATPRRLKGRFQLLNIGLPRQRTSPLSRFPPIVNIRHQRTL